MEGSEQFICAKEVGAIIGLTTATLRKDRYLGRGIPYIRAGRTIRYSLKAVLAYMQAHAVKVAPK